LYLSGVDLCKQALVEKGQQAQLHMEAEKSANTARELTQVCNSLSVLPLVTKLLQKSKQEKEMAGQKLNQDTQKDNQAKQELAQATAKAAESEKQKNVADKVPNLPLPLRLTY
jgi:hypothetical protein